MPSRIDLTGQRYGRWVVLRLSPERDQYGKRRKWFCRCDCGVERDVRRSALRNGDSTSCGCSRAPAPPPPRPARPPRPAPRSKHALWHTWVGMHQRCSNPNDPGWRGCGGRGIKVGERWSGKNGFSNFVADAGHRPSPQHLLCRWPDHRGDYEPWNTAWLLPKEAAEACRGRHRPNAKLTDDEVHAIRADSRGYKALARVLGVERTTIRSVRRGRTWQHVRD